MKITKRRLKQIIKEEFSLMNREKRNSRTRRNRRSLFENDMESKLSQMRDKRKSSLRKDAETTGMDQTDDLEFEDELYKKLVDLLKDKADSKALIANFMDRYEMYKEFEELYGEDLYDYMKSPEYENSPIHGGDHGDDDLSYFPM